MSSNLSWSVPTRAIDFKSARRRILAQHGRIRQLLSKAGQVAEAALDGTPASPDAVASAVGDVRAIMEVHLTFEEGVLTPVFHTIYADGADRVRRLEEEHQRQRAMLAGVHQEATKAPHLPMLAAKLAYLTAWLLADMDEEERTVLAPTG